VSASDPDPFERSQASPPSTTPDRRRDSATWPHNLPSQLTSFIGRKWEIAAARQLLQSTQLLTLTGSGGVGKTRLGLEVAAGLIDRSTGTEHAFVDGVWLVELATLTDPGLVPQAVATAVGVREDADLSLTSALVKSLQHRRLLLILDNCEHIVEACATLADALLHACPDLSILATSREPLGMVGETTFQVPSLSLSPSVDHPPDATGSGSEGSVASGRGAVLPERSQFPVEPEAIQLFVDRARAVMPAFSLTEHNIAAVAQICRRLDGLPLAIELAAARMAVLSPEQIGARLDDRFRLLTSGSRALPPRYRTLRALIDWSYDLLDASERILLGRLSVFAGGWTLEAAEAVCAGDGLVGEEILDLLSALAAKSLIQTEEQAEEVRYRFLESLREYAAERLRDAGEESPLRRRHRDWFLARAERVEPELLGPRSIWWMDRLESARDNLRAATGFCIERGDGEAGLRLVAALARFWQIRGPHLEIHDALVKLLALPAGHGHSASVQMTRLKALVAAGTLALRLGDQDTAETHYREVLELSRQLGDQRALAMALVSLGRVARTRGDHVATRRYDTEALSLFTAIGDELWVARTLHHLGVAAFYQGDLTTAREHYEASLAIFERLDDDLGIATLLEELGEVTYLQGDLVSATRLLRTALELAHRIDDKDRVAMAMAALAGVAAAQGPAERALRLGAAASVINTATGLSNSPAWHLNFKRWLEPARGLLDAESIAAAEAAGRSMTLEDAIEYALNGDDDPPDESASDAATGTPTAIMVSPHVSAAARLLTRRELEVVALVARGMTNRQIAEALAITEGTAANHIRHILNRLTLDSRVQVAAWAVENGLYQRART
jgi:predicted ATPase/DNA-binding CsgD family transcriptional regulator